MAYGVWHATLVKLAALDVGEARIGLAVGELGTAWVFGRGYLVRRNLKADLGALREFAEREGVGQFVIGLPLRTDGSPSAQAERVMVLVEAMRGENFAVDLFDERFTTKLGQARLMNAPKRLRQDKGKLDEASAVALLEGYLEAKRQPDRME
jgi:putative Holliday junction resolvase